MEQTEKRWLFVPLVPEKRPSGGTLQANDLRTPPVSSTEASPLRGPAPRSMGTGAVRGDNPSGLHQGSAHSFPPPKWYGRHLPPPQAGGGHRDLSGPGILSKSCTSSVAPLGRNERRKLGVVLSYVTSFLRVRGPGCHSPELWGEVGGGEGGFLPGLCLSS